MSVESQPDPQSSQIPHNPGIITPTEESLSLMDVWRTVLKQRFVILTVTVACLAGAAFYSFRTKPVYQTVSRIEINLEVCVTAMRVAYRVPEARELRSILVLRNNDRGDLVAVTPLFQALRVAFPDARFSFQQELYPCVGQTARSQGS